ncbi:MAG: YdcF family protein [Firmicutes bacterium]|nr:YdcF family protein [Bacillota bacterium]
MTSRFFLLPIAAFAVAVILLIVLPKKLKIVLLVLMALFFCVFGTAEARVIKAAKGNAEPGADYVIVLGCAVYGTVPSLAMQERCAAAAEYMLANPGCTAIVSGGRGQGEDVTEAEAMAKLLKEAGVGPERILLEGEATSTLENLEFSQRLAGFDPKSERVVICSSEYHLYRAAKSAERLFGASVETIPARPGVLFDRIVNYVREACGVIYLGMW